MMPDTRQPPVADGKEALAKLVHTRFDLILSDMVMPGIDGVALLRQVRGRHPRFPFVLVTAHDSVDSVVAAMKERVDDYLLKPLNRERTAGGGGTATGT